MTDEQIKALTIAECAKKVILDAGQDYIWAGHFGLCGDAYAMLGGKVQHPLNRTRAVIDAVRKSDLFYQSGYIRAADTKGCREILHPVFKLKKDEAIRDVMGDE